MNIVRWFGGGGSNPAGPAGVPPTTSSGTPASKTAQQRLAETSGTSSTAGPITGVTANPTNLNADDAQLVASELLYRSPPGTSSSSSTSLADRRTLAHQTANAALQRATTALRSTGGTDPQSRIQAQRVAATALRNAAAALDATAALEEEASATTASSSSSSSSTSRSTSTGPALSATPTRGVTGDAITPSRAAAAAGPATPAAAAAHSSSAAAAAGPAAASAAAAHSSAQPIKLSLHTVIGDRPFRLPINERIGQIYQTLTELKSEIKSKSVFICAVPGISDMNVVRAEITEQLRVQGFPPDTHLVFLVEGGGRFMAGTDSTSDTRPLEAHVLDPNDSNNRISGVTVAYFNDTDVGIYGGPHRTVFAAPTSAPAAAAATTSRQSLPPLTDEVARAQGCVSLGPDPVTGKTVWVRLVQNPSEPFNTTFYQQATQNGARYVEYLISGDSDTPVPDPRILFLGLGRGASNNFAPMHRDMISAIDQGPTRVLFFRMSADRMDWNHAAPIVRESAVEGCTALVGILTYDEKILLPERTEVGWSAMQRTLGNRFNGPFTFSFNATTRRYRANNLDTPIALPTQPTPGGIPQSRT